MHKQKPYNGKYGPIKKPGFIHFFSGLFFEKNLLQKSSKDHPIILPTKNKNVITKKILIN